MKGLIPIVVLAAGVAFFVIAGIFVQTHTIYNSTPSEPEGNYWPWPVANARLHGYVLVCMPEGGLVELKRHGFSPPTSTGSPCPGSVVPLVKTVVALPGDRIVVDGHGVHINEEVVPGTSPLRGWRVTAPETVPKEHVFVLGQGPDSFDSRYFGSVAPRAALSYLWF